MNVRLAKVRRELLQAIAVIQAVGDGGLVLGRSQGAVISGRMLDGMDILCRKPHGFLIHCMWGRREKKGAVSGEGKLP